MAKRIMTRIGFTGTRKGMTMRQRQALQCFLMNLKEFEFHHGDCVGADEQAHEIVLDVRRFRDRPKAFHIHIHPPIKTEFRANCKGRNVKVFPPDKYLVRNTHIVDWSLFLIAAPESIVEKNRSGTWYTVRYAMKTNVPVVILHPGG